MAVVGGQTSPREAGLGVKLEGALGAFAWRDVHTSR